MPNYSPNLSLVFQALADPTRRAVLEQLSNGPASMTTLAQPFRMALPSFSQHLGVLEKSGLVRSKKKGRVRTYQLAPKPLKAAEEWMARQRAMWERRIDQMEEYLMDMKKEQKK